MDILNGKKEGFLVKKIFIRAVCVLMGILFLYSGILKILNPFEFSLIVAKYGILPEKFINIFSTLLPFLEIFSGFFLLGGFFLRGSLILISFLLLIFTIAISYTLIRGYSFECGCFEIIGKETKTGILLIIRNLILLFLSLITFKLKT
jgi:uncharacterized membrane protein YphA (DoxX/SURF4 family)